MDKKGNRSLSPSASGKQVDAIPRVSSRTITRLLLAFMLHQTTTAMPVSSQAAALPGLSVARDGTLLRNGAPYRAVGVNYTDAFWRPLRNPGDESYRDDFGKLAANHIPFARMVACGYGTSDYRLYFQDKEKYFKVLDGVVHAAEEANVGLIANLLFGMHVVPDLVDESCNQWGNPQSKTREFMRTYVREVVSRYVNSPAIWGWEFASEYNLILDDPDHWRRLPLDPVSRSRSRSPNDTVTTEIYSSALSDFARTVREIDDHRILLTGNYLPRFNAYHMQAGRRGADSLEQWTSMLLRQSPGPFNPICIHASPSAQLPHFANRYNDLIQICARAAHSASKSLYLEEFVTCPRNPWKTECSIAARRENLNAVLAAIQANNVPLASVWAYERKMVYDPNSLSFDDDTASVLQMIADFNRKWSLR